MEMHAESLCGAGAGAAPARRELKCLCMQPAAAAAAQLMGNRLRGTWPMGIRWRSDHREDFIKNAEAPSSSLLL